eukprot:5658264-Pleurochrysis_carterae.AAC.1
MSWAMKVVANRTGSQMFGNTLGFRDRWLIQTLYLVLLQRHTRSNALVARGRRSGAWGRAEHLGPAGVCEIQAYSAALLMEPCPPNDSGNSMDTALPGPSIAVSGAHISDSCEARLLGHGQSIPTRCSGANV